MQVVSLCPLRGRGQSQGVMMTPKGTWLGLDVSKIHLGYCMLSSHKDLQIYNKDGYI